MKDEAYDCFHGPNGCVRVKRQSYALHGLLSPGERPVIGYLNVFPSFRISWQTQSSDHQEGPTAPPRDSHS
eukprot:1156618-Pelagomonas_calceolata.AAC.1